ncbi:MAG: nuclear transport factor 2 family protein [Chloroflexota bacterium]
MQNSKLEHDLIELSKEKWRWMSECKLDLLEVLFHDMAVFVHMGATMSREEELDVIRSGRIHYKEVDIQEVSARFVSATTAILLNKIRLIAVVGGNEVTNPFVVTEVYVQQADIWKLASLSFTRLVTPEPHL